MGMLDDIMAGTNKSVEPEKKTVSVKLLPEEKARYDAVAKRLKAEKKVNNGQQFLYGAVMDAVGSFEEKFTAADAAAKKAEQEKADAGKTPANPPAKK